MEHNQPIIKKPELMVNIIDFCNMHYPHKRIHYILLYPLIEMDRPTAKLIPSSPYYKIPDTFMQVY